MSKGNGLEFFDKKIPILCKFGCSLTGHKAQGGGWDYIFLDLENFWKKKAIFLLSGFTHRPKEQKETYLVNY